MMKTRKGTILEKREYGETYSISIDDKRRNVMKTPSGHHTSSQGSSDKEGIMNAIEGHQDNRE